MSAEDTSKVDMAFALQGHTLPHDHAHLLAVALCRALPWLSAEPGAGVHPVRLAPGGATGLLSGRSRLLVRIPRNRIEEARALHGQVLLAGDSELTLHDPQVRELLPHGTLYAFSVAAPEGSDEVRFMQWVQQSLLALEIRTPAVCGKHHVVQGAEEQIQTFSLMLHGLSREESMLMLNLGLGAHRLLGCGLFVPHKSAAAVGS